MRGSFIQPKSSCWIYVSSRGVHPCRIFTMKFPMVASTQTQRASTGCRLYSPVRSLGHTSSHRSRSRSSACIERVEYTSAFVTHFSARHATICPGASRLHNSLSMLQQLRGQIAVCSWYWTFTDLYTGCVPPCLNVNVVSWSLGNLGGSELKRG